SGKPWFNCRDIYTRIWCCWFNGFNCIGVILLRSFYCWTCRDGNDYTFNSRYYTCSIRVLCFWWYFRGHRSSFNNSLTIYGRLRCRTDGIYSFHRKYYSYFCSYYFVQVGRYGKRFYEKIVLNDRTTTELGYVSSDERTELIGAYGTAVTGMRPAGTMLYGDERIDVVSEGAFIDKDSHVKVINVEGNRVVVRKVNE